jgi:capsular exopolysaccharide synthesis family protein
MLPPDPKKMLPRTAADTLPDQALPGLTPPGAPGAVADPGQAPAALSSAPTLGNLLHAFRRCWRLAVPLALLAALGAGAAAWVIVPPQYTSFVTFRVSSRAPAGTPDEETSFLNVQKAHVALLKSYDVLSEAIRDSKAAEMHGLTLSPQSLQKTLVADFNEGPEVMRVSFPSEAPEAAADFLNALASVYPRRIQERDTLRIRERIDHLRKRLYGAKGAREGDPVPLVEQVREKRFELAAAEKKAGIDDPMTIASKYTAAATQLAGAQRDVRDLKNKVAALEAEQESRERRAKSPPAVAVTDAEVEEYLSRNNEYQKLLALIDLKNEEIDNIRENASREALRKGALTKPRNELRALTDRQKEMIEANRGRVAERAQAQQLVEDRKALAIVKDQIEQGKVLLRAAEIEERTLQIKVDGLRAGGPKAPPEVELRRDEVRLAEKELDQVGGQLATLEGSLPVTPRVTLLAEAFVPTEKEYIRPIKFASLAVVGAFGFVLLGMCLLESRARRVSAAGDISQALGMPVVGTLPRLPAAQRSLQAVDAGAQGAGHWGLVESIDAIRTVLLHSPRLDGLRVVMVSSAVGGEGKTTLASHLAASLARAWRKTLLIDGDLRNPAAHVQFGHPLEPGLSEVLRSEVEQDDAVRPTQLGRLWIMPAGKVDAHALQALAQEGVGGVFERLKEQYDFIVIDTSPVLPVPDALLLGKHADAVLLSVMRDVSRVPAVWAAHQKLEALGIRTLGTVVIGEKTETYGHVIPYPRKS